MHSSWIKTFMIAYHAMQVVSEHFLSVSGGYWSLRSYWWGNDQAAYCVRLNIGAGAKIAVGACVIVRPLLNGASIECVPLADRSCIIEGERRCLFCCRLFS